MTFDFNDPTYYDVTAVGKGLERVSREADGIPKEH